MGRAGGVGRVTEAGSGSEVVICIKFPGYRRVPPPRAPTVRRKPHLQGRFSGRLATKEDERRLAAECKLLGRLQGAPSMLLVCARVRALRLCLRECVW